VTRIFLSHSHCDNREAVALKAWLVAQDPPLANDIFLDLDSIRPGMKWKDALRQAAGRCEAVICLISEAWESSHECITEFRTAETLHKRIFCARLQPEAGTTVVAEWQYVDLFGAGPVTEIDIAPGTPPVAFSSEGLYRLKEEIIGKRVGPDSFVWPPTNDEHRAPYRGWQPLEQVDAGVFFGRDTQLLRALDELRGMRGSADTSMFIILGPSGAGKSSFLRAGLLPRLRRDDRNFLVFDVVRPERDVISGDNGLAKAIANTRKRLGLELPNLAEIKAACLGDTDKVLELLREAQSTAVAQMLLADESTPPPTLVLPLDQAEELFGGEAGSEGTRFLELIAEIAGAEQPQGLSLIVAATIRTDHHEALQTAAPLSAVRSVVFGDLKPMPVTEFRQVIEGPARRASEGQHPLDIEPALVERLLEDCTEGADTLPLLALTLDRLYQDYGSDGLLELREYVHMGQMRNVVQTEVDSILSRDEQSRRAELAELRAAFIPWLATINPANDQPVRQVARWDSLPDEAKPLLAKFVQRRLLVRDKRKGGDVVEVALERLFREWDDLSQWLEEERENLKKADELERGADDWDKHKRNEAWLLEGERVDDAETLMARPGFEKRLAHAREFVDASREREKRRAEERRRHRAMRRRSLIAVGVAVATIVCVVTAVAIWQTTQARQRFRENTGLRLAADAEQILSGAREGGDVRALQEILAADSLGTSASGLVNSRRNLLKIIENPAKGDGVTPIRSVAVSHPETNRIAWASDDGRVRVADADSGQPVMPDIVLDGGAPAWSVAFGPKDEWIATGSKDGLQIWNASTGHRLGGPMVHDGDGPVMSIAFSPDGNWVATGCFDGSVRLWDWQHQREGPKLAGHSGGPATVAFIPGGEFVVSGGNDRMVRLSRVTDGSPTAQQPVQSGVMSLATNPQTPVVAVGEMDGTIDTLDARTLHPTGDSIKAHLTKVNSLALTGSPDAQLVSGGADNTVKVWDLTTRAPIGQPLSGHHAEVTSVAFTADRRAIVSGSRDGSIRVWDAVKGLPIPADQGPLLAIAFDSNPDPRVAGKFFASAGTDGTIKLWRKQPMVLGRPPVPDGSKRVNSIAFDPTDPNLVLSGGKDGIVRLWDVRAPSQPTELTQPGPPVQSVGFSRDGSRFVAGASDGAIQVWDTQSRQPIRPIRVEYPVSSVALSPNGRLVVAGSGGDDSSVQVLSIDTGDPVGKRIAGRQPYAVYSVQFSPSGDRVVSAHADGTIHLWNPQTSEPAGVMSGDLNPVLSVAFSHNGRWIVSGDAAGKIRVWDAKADGHPPIGAPFDTGSPAFITSVAFSPDDSSILSSSFDGTVHFWPAPQKLSDVVCAKLATNMNRRQWKEWVSPDIGYRELCRGKPPARDAPSAGSE
jgi:WD40 repeat protein